MPTACGGPALPEGLSDNGNTNDLNLMRCLKTVHSCALLCSRAAKGLGRLPIGAQRHRESRKPEVQQCRSPGVQRDSSAQLASLDAMFPLWKPSGFQRQTCPSIPSSEPSQGQL